MAGSSTFRFNEAWHHYYEQMGLKSPWDFLRHLNWDLNVSERGDIWILWNGSQKIIETPNREAIDLFVEGMALALYVLPPKLIAEIKQIGDP